MQLTWTRQRPPVSGFYFWRPNPTHEHSVVKVDGNKISQIGYYATVTEATLGGEWAGPITAPVEQSFPGPFYERDIFKVIDEMIEVIPKSGISETALVDSLRRCKSRMFTVLPEDKRRHWDQVARTLANHLPEDEALENDWQKKVSAIWFDRKGELLSASEYERLLHLRVRLEWALEWCGTVVNVFLADSPGEKAALRISAYIRGAQAELGALLEKFRSAR